MPAFFAAVPIDANSLFLLNAYPNTAKNLKKHHASRIDPSDIYRILSIGFRFAQGFLLTKKPTGRGMGHQRSSYLDHYRSQNELFG